MKKLQTFLIYLSFLSLFVACGGVCEVTGMAFVYLTILNENGEPLKDVEASHFLVSRKDDVGRIEEMKKLVLNENDNLVYDMGQFTIKYNNCKRLKKQDEFTKEEVISALKRKGVFSVKDVRSVPVYEEVNEMSYEAVLDFCERTSASIPALFSDPMYICHCKIRLHKK